jgi:hypothetical protein
MRAILYSTAFAVLIMAATIAQAGDGHDGKSNCGCNVHCPRCSAPCEMAVTKDKVEKSCWKVECKTICIPRITFPWQSCGGCKGSACDGKCDNSHCVQKDGHGGLCGQHGQCPDATCHLPTKCGRTKNVRVLVKDKYECSVCKYKWEPADGKDGYGKDYLKDKVYEAAPAPESETPVPPPPPVAARSFQGQPVILGASTR